MQYLLRRLALSVLVLFGVSILIFTIVRLLPGDVIDMMIGTEGNMSANQQRVVRERYLRRRSELQVQEPDAVLRG